MKFKNVSLILDAKSINEWCYSVMGEEAQRKEHAHIFLWEAVNVD